MCKQDHVSENASKMSHHKHIYLSLIILFPSLLIFLFAYQQKSNTNKQITFEPDSTQEIHGMFLSIPPEQDNIFKKEKFKEIVKLRQSYLLGLKDSSIDRSFNYEEVKEACRQAFGAYAGSKFALLLRGILTANGVHKETEADKKVYKLYTPIAMGIESQNNLDLQTRYENLVEFNTIKRTKNIFNNQQLLELYRLREYYLADSPYVSKWVKYDFEDLSEAFEEACGAYSPAFKALLIQGTLTAHGYYNLNDSTRFLNFRLMTPTKMGLKYRRDRDDKNP